MSAVPAPPAEHGEASLGPEGRGREARTLRRWIRAWLSVAGLDGASASRPKRNPSSTFFWLVYWLEGSVTALGLSDLRLSASCSPTWR
jgi:hypothetical protein